MPESDDVIRLIRGGWVALCLRATCELGVVDALDRPRTLTELATTTGTDPATLARLLRVLADLDLLRRSSDGPTDLWSVTDRGEALRTGHPSAAREVALMQSALPNLTAWHSLADAVRRGEGVYEDVVGVSHWQWMVERPEEQARFNAAMARRAVPQAAAVLAAHDLGEARLLVDVGGGRGALVAALLAEHPHLRAVVADQPEVAAAATAALAEAGLGERARGEPSDFFAGVPAGGDVYVLSNVLHDWDDADCGRILRTVRDAMTPEARLLVVETVLDAPGRTAAQQSDVHLVDLHMLVLFGARERTKAEYDALLTGAGFVPSTLEPSPTTWSVLETRRTP